MASLRSRSSSSSRRQHDYKFSVATDQSLMRLASCAGLPAMVGSAIENDPNDPCHALANATYPPMQVILATDLVFASMQNAALPGWYVQMPATPLKVAWEASPSFGPTSNPSSRPANVVAVHPPSVCATFSTRGDLSPETHTFLSTAVYQPPHQKDRWASCE